MRRNALVVTAMLVLAAACAPRRPKPPYIEYLQETEAGHDRGYEIMAEHRSTTPIDQPDVVLVPITGPPTTYFGKGYSYGIGQADGSKPDQCVKYSESQVIDPIAELRKAGKVSADQGYVTMELSRIDHTESVFSSFGASLQASFSYASAGGSLAVSLYRESKIHSYGASLAVRERILTDSKILGGQLELTKPAQDACNKDRVAFLKMCGNKFVYGSVSGAELTAVVDVSETDAFRRQEIGAAMSFYANALASSGDTQAQAHSTLVTAEQKSSLKVYGQRSGPINDNPLTVDELQKAWKTLPTDVKNAGGGVPQFLAIADYNFASCGTDAGSAGLLDRAGAANLALYDSLTSLRGLASASGDSPYDPNELDALIRKYTKVRLALNNEFDRCSNDRKQCSNLQKLVDRLEVEMPGSPQVFTKVIDVRACVEQPIKDITLAPGTWVVIRPRGWWDLWSSSPGGEQSIDWIGYQVTGTQADGQAVNVPKTYGKSLTIRNPGTYSVKGFVGAIDLPPNTCDHNNCCTFNGSLAGHEDDPARIEIFWSLPSFDANAVLQGVA